MNKRQTLSKRLFLDATTLTAASIGTLLFMQVSHAQEAADSPVEEIVITGVKQSIQDAASIKRKASQIMDVISAEDIGQLPDNNIAEAMQRVTGVQISRGDTGEGDGFQVRGLSENRVEVNGRSMSSSGE